MLSRRVAFVVCTGMAAHQSFGPFNNGHRRIPPPARTRLDDRPDHSLRSRVGMDLLHLRPTSVNHSSPEYNNDDNPTPFGAILRGELPAVVYAETDTLLVFADRSPHAELHALVIPKRRISSVMQLTAADLPLLREMKAQADSLVRQMHDADDTDTAFDADRAATLVFHIPPFYSVSHLHLHVLAPVQTVSCWGRWKFWSETRWCTRWDTVVQRLEQGLPAVPY